MKRMSSLSASRDTIWLKLARLNWGLFLLICVVTSIGLLSLYSAAGGNMSPWAIRQLMRFIFSIGVMLFIALVDIKWWFRLSYLAFAGGVFLLIVVEVMGHVGMGAQRWINLGFMKLQPSELMKIAVVMALARFYALKTTEETRRLWMLIPPLAIILLPVSLVLLQPDLGTSLMIVMAGASVIFLAGVPLWIFVTAGVLTVLAIPIAWQFMHSYQKQRVLTFLNPESDPLGAGYHITQSKIALGSGGIEGKGFLQGTQSRLNFLPEKQTDFIFTLWAEEWGLVGGIFLLLVLGAIFVYGLYVALTCRHVYGRLLAMGLIVNFSLYVFINIGMVMGLMPVVGAPLPLVSYGGTSMLSAMIGFGLVMSCSIHRDSKMQSG
ncbi:MAG: rod shape-determining protein RodA [Pseudomonadota bacterium]|jgi:rod shape determining protein RodA|nr:rod shape-determining protein RodA [Alphaproteobacteria bacterium]MEC7701225.1 rod shape-determining protein RodA [Pseudomonadota bacterium]MEC9236682.1 rod shape-determining protein RodA [Pseudomonadota bacterium]|tara:strand:- start:481528 stop:482661 length:1134 start_codon:yes stop_codon:yes gene_type:complete